MKICLIINSFGPKLIGGSNVYAWNLAQKLLTKKHEIIVITVEPGKDDLVIAKNGLTIYQLNPANIATSQTIGKSSIVTQGIWTLLDIYNPFICNKIKKILKKEKPNVAHIHTPVDITMSTFTAVKSLKIPLVFTAHDYLLLCRRVTLLHASGELCSEKNILPLCKAYRAFTKKIAEDATDIVITPSEFVLNKLRNCGFFEKTKAKVLPYGVILDNMQHNSVQRPRKKLNLLYVGSITKHKGIDTLIRAVKNTGNMDAMQLTIVGEGVYEKELKLLAGNDQRITFTGKANNDKITAFYDKADLLVVPSIWFEALGIVIQEAFRSGIPVAASCIGGIPEIVKDGYNGFLFEPGNVEQLTQIFEKCLNDPSALSALSVNAFESVKKYSMEEHIIKLEEVYAEAATKKNAD